jgi:hypothetical protein
MGGQTCHLDELNHFLHELKDEGLIVVKHISGDENEATKNTAASCLTGISLSLSELTSTWKKATLKLELGRVLERSF